MRNTMTVEILTFEPIEGWSLQRYGPEVCEILVTHCEIVHKNEVVYNDIYGEPETTITAFEYRLSDRGETLLALTNQACLAALQRREARDLELKNFHHKENPNDI